MILPPLVFPDKCNTERHYAEHRYTERRYAECRYAECRYGECRGAIQAHRLLINISDKVLS